MTDLGFPPSDVALANLKRLGEGRQAEVFAWSDGAVVKLFRSAGGREGAAREARGMTAAEASGVAMAKVLGTVTIEGRPGIVMERLEGTDQLTLLARKPWRVWSVGRTLGRLHAQLHSAPAAGDLRPLKEAVRASIEESDRVPDDLRRLAIEALARLPDGDFVCHGDFHPANIIETKAGPKVIDWSNAVRGDRLADLARTTVMFGGGDTGQDPPLLLRLLDRFGRGIVWRAYSRTYRRLRPYRQEELEAWIPVVAAQRLTENIPGERDYLLALLARLVPATPPRS